jgi:hypothetical protein
MSNELKPLILDPGMQAGLPVGYRKIMVSDEIMDAPTMKVLTLELPKYGHSSAFVRRPNKPISKPEL